MNAWRFVARARHVLDVRARVQVRLCVGTAFPAQLEHPVAQAAQEFPVVRYEQHGPLEITERFEQHFLGRKVEMVRRLVQHQEVRRIEQHARHDEPGFFAT